MYKATRISQGKYLYRGYQILNCGYYQPEQKIVWEAHDKETGEAVAHAFRKRDVIYQIDNLFDTDNIVKE